ncbi:GNAT family N-acetyltransferase [Paenibacillus silagei]|uniref:Ribosomal protein S18 acetylase RimI-like enzyme n=1 Tax=Paenibacillus silagei TaxID=1670801 RepID=A0ABS4NKI7_9BACL|nr:GNAT family N-acetyltransferase [Paenibacillus silagei]MBP2110566.1 ribosomal protein S18 acetylase RimI-like enzyme [Paenibacillus silagei]
MGNIVRQVIHEWNPYGLLPEAPIDEFDSEIEKVVQSLTVASTVEELAKSIQEIFSSNFGEPFRYEGCFIAAKKIWEYSIEDKSLPANIEIVSLTHENAYHSRNLLCGFNNSSSNGVDTKAASIEELEQSGQVIKRILDTDLAICYLAKFESHYAGFIICSWGISVSNGHPILRIDGLYVASEFRNKGIAKALMNHVIDLANEKKATRIQLDTDADNIPASSLYVSFGFEKIYGKEVYMLFCS